MRTEWPSDRRAAEKRDELASSHMPPSRTTPYAGLKPSTLPPGGLREMALNVSSDARHTQCPLWVIRGHAVENLDVAYSLKADIAQYGRHFAFVPRTAVNQSSLDHLIGEHEQCRGAFPRTYYGFGTITVGDDQSFGRISTNNMRRGMFVLFSAVCARFPVSKKYSPAL